MEVARARPITGLIFGLIFGVALAVILQQAGIWPLDKLTLFLLPGITALVFIFLARIGRESAPTALTVALILLIAPIAYGLTGIGDINESGQLNGGCTVEAASDVDTTVVTDTSRSDPFDIDPDGGLSWFASSPGPITDHEWEIWVVVGDWEYVVADGAEENSDMSTTSEGDEPSLRGYVEDLGFRAGEQIQGVYEVGGFIDGDGGACDGFGFVRIEGSFLGTIVYWIAFIVALLSLIIFSIIAFTGRERPVTVESGEVPEDGVLAGTAYAGTSTAGAGSVEDDGSPPESRESDNEPPESGRHRDDTSDF